MRVFCNSETEKTSNGGIGYDFTMLYREKQSYRSTQLMTITKMINNSYTVVYKKQQSANKKVFM